MQQPIRIGTRGSQLALVQTRHVQALLAAAHGVAAEEVDTLLPIEVIKTSGDRIQDRPLNQIGGKGLFTKEIEEAMIEKSIDIAVHSMKDMPTVLPDGLCLTAVLEREDPRDAFIGREVETIADLPAGAVIGSTSLRRQAQIKALRPDLEVITYRGNVDTRLRKLKAGEVDGTLLAVAGLNRLGLQQEISSYIPEDMLVPAVAQGAVTIEARSDDDFAREHLQPLNHHVTEFCTAIERAFMKELDGSCRTPLAGFARYLDARKVRFDGRVLMPEGNIQFDCDGEAEVATLPDCESWGCALGQELRGKAGVGFFEEIARLSSQS